MPWVDRVHDPFSWRTGVGARSGSRGAQVDQDKEVELARRAVCVWHFVLIGRRRISGNQVANLALNLGM
jgi:hypothetical protein